MFERFTNRSRRVLVVAQGEAQVLQHDYIGTEHLLLGVMGVGDQAVAEAFAPYGFTVDDVRARIAESVGPTEDDPTVARAFTPRAKKVLELSLRETLQMGHSDIEVAHVLLAILREGAGVAAKVLNDLGVDYDRVRLSIGQRLAEDEPVRRRVVRRRVRGRDPLEPSWPLGTPPVNRVRLRAEAHTGPLGTHDLLLALLDEQESMAARVLQALGVTKEQVEAKVAEIGIENTSDAPPKPAAKPTTVRLSEGVEIRISAPDLANLAESGQLEDLLKEIVRRSKPEA